MTRTYTTQEYSTAFQDTFYEWFDDAIGTDYNIDHPTAETFVITFFELTAQDVAKIRRYENGKFKKLVEGV